MSKSEKIKAVRLAANAVFHGAKVAEKLSEISTADTKTTKVKKFANAIRHIATGVEQGLGLRRK